jgi:NAD(P)-dependent dehydrogenase (short-subunit alcohol dehydrogenase family)
MRLADKVSVITGAGSGMGRVAALRFAAEGSRVVVADTNGDAADETVRQIVAAGGEAVAAKVDISREPDAHAMIDLAVSKFGRIDVLYNNAGIMPEADHSVVDTPVETWDQVMAVNVRGVYLACKYAIPHMVERRSGSIINVSSFVAILGCSVPQDAYTASKGAVLALTRSLAVQFAPQEAPARAQPHRALREGRRGGRDGCLPRLRRVGLDQRRFDGHRRRHKRELLLRNSIEETNGD